MSTQKTVMLPFEEGERHSPSVPDGASFSGHMDMQDNLQKRDFFSDISDQNIPCKQEGLDTLKQESEENTTFPVSEAGKLQGEGDNHRLMNTPHRFLNRELSWLNFNARVLQEAENSAHPVLERLRFLSISASNMDEFYMVRVAGLRAQERKGILRPSQDGLTPSRQLELINELAGALMEQQQTRWLALKEELSSHNIHVLETDGLRPEEKDWLHNYFLEHIFPLLTPLAIDPAHPFPFLPNLGFALALDLRKKADGQTMKALLPIPQGVKRFIDVSSRHRGQGEYPEKRFIALEKVLTLFLEMIFPGYSLEDSGTFRLIRDSDIEIEDEAEDLVRQFETALKQRRRGKLVRLKIDNSMSLSLRNFIAEHLKPGPQGLVIIDGILGLEQVSQLITPDRPDLQFPPYEPRFPERILHNGGDCFAAIREKDILVHHPYESFNVVISFLEQAAHDPDVVAIKQTLYRTSQDSPIVAALIEAAEAGKNVTALVELKARFDEEANLQWARDLERAGVQVVYGFLDYKIHAKTSLVIRREGRALRSYAHYGTGNYHPVTARVYTDLSLFTASPGLCRDAGRVFNYITGYAHPEKLEHLSISPLNLKDTLLELLEQEVQNASAGRPAAVWAKLNALVDPDMIDALYRASQKGVDIDLIVRGICCLRPGLPGLSERIRVKSIVGRFLEHARIVCFANGEALPSPQAKVFLSSADWMPRNFDHRVEILCPVENSTVHNHILHQIMVANLKDEAQSWYMGSDGRYQRVCGPVDKRLFNAHTYFMNTPSLSGRGEALSDHAPPELS